MAREWIGPKKEPTPRVVLDGTWMQRHPTRYGWHSDVRDVVDKVFRGFGGEPWRITINTYVDHPEGWSEKLGYDTQRRSFDTWGPRGRGDPINPDLGDRIVRFIFSDPDPPWISWLIWQGRIWSRAAGGIWMPWDDDGTGLHFDHPHCTYMPKGFTP